MEEIWKKVPYEGLEDYEVSTFGNIRLLPREVKTKCVTRGKELIVTAHRKGKNIKVQYEDGRPLVRMNDGQGHRRKFSVPLLMLKMFKLDECPGPVERYTAAYLDGNTENNNIDNLAWISKADLMNAISRTTKGEPKPHLAKYVNVVIKVNDNIVGYFANTTEGEFLFNSYGLYTSASAIGRSLNEKHLFFNMFNMVTVSDEDYYYISRNYKQLNLKIIHDIIIAERSRLRKEPKTIVKKEKEIVEKVVYKPKIEKQIVEKIVYVDKETNERVRKPYKKDENKQVKSKFISTPTEDKLSDIDDSEFYKEQERLKAENKNKFKEELLKRMGGAI